MRRRASRVALLLLALGLAITTLPTGQAQADNCNAPTGGTWRISAGTVTCINRVVTITDLIIEGGASLTFQGGQLWIDSPTDAAPSAGPAHGISLYGTGERFTADHTVIASKQSDKRAHFHAASSTTLRILDSTVQDIYSISLGISLAGYGVAEATFERNEFIGLDYGIWFVGGTSPGGVTIRDNFFDGSEGNSILSQGSALIEGNTIVRCGNGIDLRGSTTPTIRHNTVAGCVGGIGEGNGDAGPQVINDNDIFGSFDPTCSCASPDAAFDGDGTNNWWGRSPPDPTKLFWMDYEPWRTAPVHPERLPSVSMGSLPATVAPGQAVSFTGSGSPSSTFNFPIASLEWSFGDGSKAMGTTASHSYASPGTYIVEFTAKDTKGLSRMAQGTIQVVQAQGNQAPTVSMISISPASPAAGQSLAATVSASDPDDESLSTTYVWMRNGQTQGDLTSNTVPSGRTAANEDWQVTATVRDPNGAQDSKSASAHVTASSSSGTSTPPSNHAPVVTAASATPNPAAIGQNVALHLSASDSDGDALTTTWTLPSGATLTGPDATTTFSTAGIKSIQYRVTDGKSPVTGTVSLTVNESPPNAPTSLTLHVVSGSQIDLSWGPPSGPVTNYKIYRGTSSGSESLIYTTSTTSPAFSNTAGLNPCTTYYYHVRAVNNGGESPTSNEASATTIGCSSPPSGDSGGTGSGTSGGSSGSGDSGASSGAGSDSSGSSGMTVPAVPIASSPGTGSEPGPILTTSPTFTWSPVQGATTYTLWISKAPYGSSNIVVLRSGLSATSSYVELAQLPPDSTQFRWAVTASNSVGESPQSNIRYFQTPPPTSASSSPADDPSEDTVSSTAPSSDADTVTGDSPSGQGASPDQESDANALDGLDGQGETESEQDRKGLDLAAKVESDGFPWLYAALGGVWLPVVSLGVVLLRGKGKQTRMSRPTGNVRRR
ncbi:MAG: PKD domain-containing protein [Candidatus Thermoplasmatota archaeon]